MTPKEETLFALCAPPVDELEEWRWGMYVIDAYKAPLDFPRWRPCPVCNRRPRVWKFDNGRYAKCMCGGKYDGAHISAEPIGDCVRRTGGFAEYKDDELLDNWNDHVAGLTLK